MCAMPKRLFFRSLIPVIVFFILFLMSVVVNAQVSPNYEMPKIIAPAPTAAAFARYGDIPVSLSTGVPSIEIPLYTVTSRRLSVPLTLSYHASGIKVNDVSTPVGLGWVLKGQGMVSRTVLDRPDEEVGDAYGGGKAIYRSEQSYQNAITTVASTWAARIVLGEQLYRDLRFRDKQSDRFTYELPGNGGGAYRYDFNTGECITMPYRPVKISDLPNVPITTVSITDEKGVVYTYGKAFTTDQSSTCTGCIDGNTYTSWYITEIRDSYSSDKIEYEYEENVTNDFALFNATHTASWGYRVPQLGGGIEPDPVAENYQSFSRTTTHEPLLKRIVSATTIVTFEYVADRSDWIGTRRLSAIKVFDKVGDVLVKEIVLDNNQYFGSSNYHFYPPTGAESDQNLRLKLAGVIFKGNNGQQDQKYEIRYNEADLPPYNSGRRFSNGFTLVYTEDYWGYFTGSYFKGLIPSEFLPGDYAVWTGNRRATSAGLSGMISEIVYPTGGKTSFEFESNYATQVYNGVSGIVGGARIKKITSTGDVPFSTIEKSYSYGDGIVPRTLDRSLFVFDEPLNWDYTLCYGGPTIGSGPRKTTIQSSSFSSVSFSNGASVIYPRVTEYLGSENFNSGKTEYHFALPDEYANALEMWSRAYGAYWYDNGACDPRLITKKVFKNVSGVYVQVHELSNSYQAFHNTTYPTGVNVIKTSFDIDRNSPKQFIDDGYLFGVSCPNAGPSYIYYFSYVNTSASGKVYLLSGSEEKEFRPDGVNYISKTTAYTYGNPSHLQPTEKLVHTSTGEVLKTTYQYPQDNTVDAFAYYMTQGNMLNTVIEAKNYRNNTFLNSAKTFYKATLGPVFNILVPDYVQTQVLGNVAENRLTYHQYDLNGNVTDVSKQDDAHEIYLYGYQSTLPIAKILTTAVTYAQVTSLVNQSLLDNPPDENALRVHLQSLRVALPGALVYSYTYKPLVGVSSETDPSGKTTYYEYDYAGRLALIRNQEGQIVRRICYNHAGQPENCFTGMYYSAYKVGDFSKNDCATGYKANGTVRYSVPQGKYSSAASQAAADLLAEQDLAVNGQARANQLGACVGIYSNEWQMVLFTRNDCASGYTGTSVPYSVPEGVYHSAISVADANQQALNYIYANGQAYANGNAQCIANTLPFARIRIENDYGVNGNYYGDIVVRFYQDYQCTIPLNVNLTCVVEEQKYTDATNQFTYTTHYIGVNGNSAVLFPNVLRMGIEGGNVVERYYNLLTSPSYTIAY